jgi:AraC-like DNA-binding protein
MSTEKTVKVFFKNTINPKSSFDLLLLEDLYKRKDLDHNVEEIHRVDFYLLLFVTEGNGSHFIDFKNYNLKKGSLLTIRKDQIHKFQKSESLKGYVLLITDDFLVSYLEKQEALKTLQLFNELLDVPKVQLEKNGFKLIQEILERIQTEYFKVMDDYTLGIIRSELHILITKLFRIKSEGSDVLNSKKYLAEFIEFQTLIEQEVFQSKRVLYYANKLFISTKTLNTISRSIVNKSAKQFIDEIAIKQIKRMLINTPFPIKEIAYKAGFEETSNFYKYFKRHVGITPEKFRVDF